MSDNISKIKAILNKHITEEKIINILDNVANKVKDDIVSLAPSDTGNYRSSIQVSNVEKNNNIYKIEIYSDLNSGWKNIPLGYLLEWGTGVIGEGTNSFDHGYPYRQTPWVYFNERYGKWLFTQGMIARPHFYPGLRLNESYFKETILKEISK